MYSSSEEDVQGENVDAEAHKEDKTAGLLLLSTEGTSTLPDDETGGCKSESETLHEMTREGVRTGKPDGISCAEPTEQIGSNTPDSVGKAANATTWAKAMSDCTTAADELRGCRRPARCEHMPKKPGVTLAPQTEHDTIFGAKTGVLDR
jgi:hypothetical protein